MAVKSVTTIDELRNIAVKNGSTVYCTEMRTTYKFHTHGSATYIVNNMTILSSLIDSDYRWVGVSGRNVYDPTVDSGGDIKSNNSTRAVHFGNLTINELRNRNSFEGEVVYCRELRANYQYFGNVSFIPIDGTQVIDSLNSSSARWIAVGGNYVYTSIDNYSIKIGGTSSGSLNIPLVPPANVSNAVSVSDQLKNPVLIFYQEFSKGAGWQSTYTVTNISNGSLSLPFAPGQIVTAKPIEITFADGNPVYDNFFPRTQAHRITGTIDSTGLVTLSATPYSGYTDNIRIYFFYSLVSGEVLYSYSRDELVNHLELSFLNFAQDIKVANQSSLFPGMINDVEAALNYLQTQINNIGALTTPAKDRFISTNGQSVFILSNTPASYIDDFEIELNGQDLEEIDDYTVSGHTITLVPSLAANIIAGDKLIVRYRY